MGSRRRTPVIGLIAIAIVGGERRGVRWEVLVGIEAGCWICEL